MPEKQNAYTRADFFAHLDNNPGSRYNDLVRNGGRDVAYDAYLKAAKAVEVAPEEKILVETDRVK
ncbi:MAG: hypothetical protein RLZZ283_96 [Candidatus Parcubacteria bacterium]|jgi:hypothetical protein